MQSNKKTKITRPASSRSDHLITILLVVSLVIHIAGAYVFYRWDDLRYSVMRYDPDAVEELSEEAKAREEERKKREDEKRERTEIKEEDAREIMKEEERRKKKEIRKQIEELKRQKEELENLVDDKRNELVERNLDEEQPETPALTSREKFEILKKRTEGLENDNDDMKGLIEALDDLRHHNRRKNADQIVEERKAVEVKSQEVITKLGNKLKEDKPQIGSLAIMLGDFSEMQDKSWKQAESAAALQRYNEKSLRSVKSRTEELKQAIRARESGDAVHKDFRDVSKSELQSKIENAHKSIEKTERSLQKDQTASRQAHKIAREAMEINQLALEFLADFLSENMNELSALEMYELAQTLEKSIAQNFAELRAQELALLQNDQFDQALSDITVPQSDRPNLADQLNFENVETVGDLQAFREGLETALNQSRAMSMNAENMLNQAKGLNQRDEKGSDINMTAMRRAMMEGAQKVQSQQGQMIDMSGIMRAASGGNQSTNLYGGAGDGTGPQGGPANLRAKLTWNESRLNERRIIASAMPGRKFTKDSKRMGWLYIDTWYIIGPYEASHGIDYTHKHEPETVIDLDAQYKGKIDPATGQPRKLEWQFYQSSTLRMRPPNETTGATYYAYTEIFFEEGTDLLLAVGSDDGAKVWINDLVVWQDDELSGWNLEEGYRKVYFKKGYNKILVRLGNGPNTCTFSVLLCPPDALK
jgi:hypothetical protein